MQTSPEAHVPADVVPGALTVARLTKHTLVFGIGALVGKAIGFVMLPVLTRALPPDEFGRVDVLMTLGSALISTFLFGVDVAAIRAAADLGKAGRSSLFGSWYAISLGITVPVALALAALGGILSGVLFGTSAYSHAFTLVGLVLVLGTLQVIGLGVLRVAGRAVRYAAVSALTLAIYAVLALVLLAVWDKSAATVLTAYAIALGVGVVFGIVATRDISFGRPNQRAALALLRLGVPIAPAVIATWVGDFAGRAILIGSSGATEVGYLAVALRFTSIAALVVTAIQLAWQPHAFAIAGDAGGAGRVRSEVPLIVSVVVFSAVVVASLAPEVLQLASGSEYAPARAVIGMALIGVIAGAILMVESTGAVIGRATGAVGIAGSVGVLGAIVLNLGLSPVFGAVGTGAALAAGQFIGASSLWWLNRRRDHQNLTAWQTWLGASAGSLLIAGSIAEPIGTLPVRVGILILATAAIAWFVRRPSVRHLLGH